MGKDWKARDKKLRKRRYGMRIGSKSVFTIQERQKMRADLKRKRRRKKKRKK
jgi:hypothetical protein